MTLSKFVEKKLDFINRFKEQQYITLNDLKKELKDILSYAKKLEKRKCENCKYIKKQDELMKEMLRFIELNKEQYWLNDRGWKDYDKIIQKAKQWEGKE